jgi:hypothetical protein
MKPELPFAVSWMQSFSMLCRLSLLLIAPFVFGGCIHVSMDPVQVNANINVNIKVDKALDDFFGDLDKKSATINAPAAKS